MAKEKLERLGYRMVELLDGGFAEARNVLPVIKGKPLPEAPPDPDGLFLIDLHASRVGWTGRFGHPIVRLLRTVGHCPTVLEKDSDHAEFLRRIGAPCYYGDASRLEPLHSAGAADAKIMIIVIDNEDDCMKIIDHCQHGRPPRR